MQTNANKVRARITGVRSIRPRRYARSYDAGIAAFLRAETEEARSAQRPVDILRAIEHAEQVLA